MSRVSKPNKYMNTPKHDPSITNPSKVKRTYRMGVGNYFDAECISEWLAIKYGMTYAQYKRRPQEERAKFQKEYTKDTGLHPGEQRPKEEPYNECMQVLYECGVPFGPLGEPIGI